MQVKESQKLCSKKNRAVSINSDNAKTTSFLVAILPILSIYKLTERIPNFGIVAIATIALLSLINAKGWIKIPKFGFIWYFTIWFLISLISRMLRNQSGSFDFLSQYVRIFLFYYIIDIASNNKLFNYTLMQRYNVIAGLTVAIILFLQEVIRDLFDKILFFFIPVFHLDYNLTATEIIALHTRLLSTQNWRPFSIFCEPAHYAQFVLLSLAISLFCNENVFTKHQKLWISLFLSLSILLSYSANGMFVMILLWGIWLIWYSRMKKSFLRLVVILLIIILFIMIIVTTDFLDKAMERIDTASLDHRSTGTLRFFQGIEVFKRLNLAEKIFGVGFGNIRGYLIDNNITTKFLSEVGNTYMNGFSTVLVSGGIVGFVFYCIIWIRLFFVHKSVLGRVLLISITALFCSSALFLSCTSVMYLVFIQCSENRNDVNRKIIRGPNLK